MAATRRISKKTLLEVLESGRYWLCYGEFSYNRASGRGLEADAAPVDPERARLAEEHWTVAAPSYGIPFLGQEKVAALSHEMARLAAERSVGCWRALAAALSEEEWASMWATLRVRGEVAAVCAAWEAERAAGL
jgi:hypothetical protein